MKKFLGLCAVALTLTACAADPVVGDWEDEDNSSGYQDELVVFDGGTGERTLEIRDSSEGVSVIIEIKWDIEWEESGDGEYDAEIDCDDATVRINGELYGSGCSEVSSLLEMDLDDETECQVNDAGDEMDCEMEGGLEVTYERKN
jgi:hypothetical protein